MVANEDTQANEIHHTTDNTGAFEKLKQTLSSSLLTAQDKGNEQKTHVMPTQHIISTEEKKVEIFDTSSFHDFAKRVIFERSSNIVAKILPFSSLCIANHVVCCICFIINVIQTHENKHQNRRQTKKSTKK